MGHKSALHPLSEVSLLVRAASLPYSVYVSLLG
ncbi:hypothetical protein LMG31886_44220 [Xanthomonas hydrangeae]|nr:hypothetical protein LMG31885_16170 [Xanthomonas hydrangeae]CAD7731444.1 hypothetical protein LMG31885_16170 [Xanthomonas hydrangeae]CAD7747712.1 hypothetical protein LMG31886_44220 [Xanthomonas hydrangeae]CAD7747713.1 hypothetical protein LMG31886_44220 [Xanthomonas hydrangeae]